MAINIPLQHAQQKTENVVLVTLDGLRWQEVFGGAVDSLMNDLKYVKDTDTLQLQQMFDASTPEERRKKLMPWLWSEVATTGQIYGNRWEGNSVRCSNSHWFSYPGYNEILTGFSDPNVTSNAKKYNENMTVLEWINNLPSYNGHVAAFASWDVFPYIINDQRSGIPVNAGFQKASGKRLSNMENILNQLQDEIPSPWSSVRLDAFTHHFTMEYLKKEHPRVVYIAYGETDDFAHDGEYDHYLQSAHQTDSWLKDLWTFLQKDRFYRGKTTLIITTDHGRGESPKAEWQSHGKTYNGSPFIWLAALGPDTPALGEIKTEGRLFQNQIAKTLASFLGLDYTNEREEVGEVIETMFSGSH
ncbi:MAG: phosphoglyceromutase [Saprospiraceae bacterium]|nr:phosphoglyceromutase [Saprospiraceae bacterium]